MPPTLLSSRGPPRPASKSLLGVTSSSAAALSSTARPSLAQLERCVLLDRYWGPVHCQTCQEPSCPPRLGCSIRGPSCSSGLSLHISSAVNGLRSSKALVSRAGQGFRLLVASFTESSALMFRCLSRSVVPRSLVPLGCTFSTCPLLMTGRCLSSHRARTLCGRACLPCTTTAPRSRPRRRSGRARPRLPPSRENRCALLVGACRSEEAVCPTRLASQFFTSSPIDSC